MRQAGVLGECGRLALQNIARLAEDHTNAQAIARGIASLPGITVCEPVESNLLYFKFSHPSIKYTDLHAYLKERGVLVGGEDQWNRIRIACHLDVHKEDVPVVIDAFAAGIAALSTK